MVFPAYQDQTACRECPVFRGRKDPREEKVQKDKTVIKDHKECRVQEETEGAKDPLGRVDPEELREWKVNRDFWEWKESKELWELKVIEVLWEIQEEKETKERKEKAPKQVKQV